MTPNQNQVENRKATEDRRKLATVTTFPVLDFSGEEVEKDRRSGIERRK